MKMIDERKLNVPTDLLTFYNVCNTIHYDNRPDESIYYTKVLSIEYDGKSVKLITEHGVQDMQELICDDLITIAHLIDFIIDKK
jgi:hypothetical protein